MTAQRTPPSGSTGEPAGSADGPHTPDPSHHRPVVGPTKGSRSPLRPIDPRRNRADDTAPAGTVFVVMVGTLLTAALLNAEVMLDRTRTGELDTGRDVALAWWRPVHEVADTLGLTWPRAVLDRQVSDLDRAGDQRVLGDAPVNDVPLAPPPTSSDDPSGPTVIDTPLGLPQPSTGSTTTPPRTDGSVTASTPPASDRGPDTTSAFPLRRPTVDQPLRVVIVGDSTMDAPGNAMVRQFAETELVEPLLDYRISSGLARPDFFDWPNRLAGLQAEFEPEVAVVMLGANDAQPFFVDGEAEPYGTDRWRAAYRQRVGQLIDQLTADGTWVVWIGQPAMQSSDFNQKMAELDELVVAELATRPMTRYVDARHLLGVDGAYAAYLPDESGASEQVRFPDGVHLTEAGGERLAATVVDTLNGLAPLY